MYYRLGIYAVQPNFAQQSSSPLFIKGASKVIKNNILVCVVYWEAAVHSASLLREIWSVDWGKGQCVPSRYFFSFDNVAY